jgi:glyoxylase-like metal-dependent hydrolase (beta-lactamase superfamily II)
MPSSHPATRLHVRARSLARFAGLILALTCVLSVMAVLRSQATPRAPVWQVYAIRYATLPGFPVHELVAGADTTRTLDIAMMFWLLKGPDGRRVLVDAGFYRQKFLDSWNPADYRRPSDAVQRLGIPADSITDVIISHVHWDHLDGADLFANARVWIQRAEYEYYVGADGAPLHDAIDTTDAAMLAQLNHAGRVKLVEGDAREILPGLTAYTGGKHTFASQYVGVRTAAGTVVLASDNCYLFENLLLHRPIAQTLDSTSNLAAQERMKRLASAPRLIVPGHDPAVFTRYQIVGPGIVAIE